MSETEEQRRARLAERIENIRADERYSPTVKAFLIDEETKVAERQIAEAKASNVKGGE